MKGRNVFTKAEVEGIKKLIAKKVIASKQEQKVIRNKIRKDYKFYISDFSSKKGYTVLDFEALLDSRAITINNII